MPIDRLDALLQRFTVSARMFHSGPLCGVHDFAAREDQGQLHLIKRGPLQVVHGPRRRERIETPSLILYPRPMRHRFITDDVSGADMACANVVFSAGATNPLARALPDVVVMPLSDVEDARPVLDLLFREAFAQACGRQHVVDRLFEVVLVLILRTLMNRARVDDGLLAGMSHPQLARALIAMHEAPGEVWALDALASRAGMSRSHFAATFHRVVGLTPGDYLATYRVCLAQDLLRKGSSLKVVAEQVGYGSSAAFSRAFSSVCGQSPRQWKSALAASASRSAG